MVISDYYKNLPHREKGKFVLAICEICGLGHSTVQKKLKKGFKPLEEKAVIKYINEAKQH